MKFSVRTSKRVGVVSALLLAGLSLHQLQAQEPKTNIATDVLDRREVDGKAVYFADDVSLGENDRLVFDEASTVHVKNLKMGEYSVIDSQGNDLEILVEEDVESDKGFLDVSAEFYKDTSGADGQNGGDGKKAQDGLKGSAGAHGSDASDGTDGVDGAKVSLIVPKLRGDVIFITKGGNGGTGGNGGDGGRGGVGFSGEDARILLDIEALDALDTGGLLEIGAAIGVPYVGQVLAIISFFNGISIGDGFDGYDGGAGGDAGNGGHGGDGGDGGPVELIYASKSEDSKIYVNTRGGSGGAGGVAGVPGVGGPGGLGGKAGDIWAKDGAPGKAGPTGQTAQRGEAGEPGLAGEVKVIETGDELWLRCYVRYRSLIDFGADREDALNILTACLN